jgi:hypothetical protein
MQLRTPALIAILLLGLGLAAAGCSDSESVVTGTGQPGSDDYEKMDMSEPHGGLTATDELEAFGDDELLLAAAADEGMEVDDPMAADPTVQRWRRLGEDATATAAERPRFTFLRVTWGRLDASARRDAVTDLVDWTGILRVDRGAVVVRRLICFERPFDHLVYPRLDRRTVAWISHTGPHFDGLLLEIIEPPAAEDTSAEPNELHFETGPYTGSFVVSELPDLDETFAVEPEGNAIQFNGFTLADVNACPKGFLSGLWRPVPVETAEADTTGVLGHFRGRWIGLHGALQGYLRGAYGLDEDGDRVFVGKYIDRFGRFCGFLEGSWEPGQAERAWADFRGTWVGAAGRVQGVLGGRAYHLPVHSGGFFEGRWATICDLAAEEMIP